MRTVTDKVFEELEDMIITGKYQEVLQEINSIEQRSDITFEEEVICQRLKTQLFSIYQQFSKAIEYGEIALQNSIKLGNKLLIIDSALHYGRSLCLTGKIDVGAEKLKLAEETIKSFEDKKSPEFLKRKSLILCHSKGWRDGFEILFEQLNQALQIAEGIKYNYGRVSILGKLASLYQWYGDIHNAVKYYNICLELAKQYNYLEQIMGCYVSLGTIDLHRGELESSLHSFMKGLPLAEKMESAYALSFILGDIGFLYWQKHDLSRTLEYYNRCIRILQESDNTNHRQYPWILFRLILVLLEQNEFEEAKENLEKIRAISELQNYRQQHLSHKIYKLSKAIVLKGLSPDNNFEEITDLLNETAYDFLVHNELNKVALFHLCDLYFNKLIKTNDLEIINYIKTKVNDLEKLATEHSSSIILAETLLFESQLSLLELDVSGAILLLNKAQKIAEEKEIHRLANLISNAHDKIIENLDQWENASLVLSDIIDRLELTHIEDLLHKLVRNKIIYTDIAQEEEQPVVFFIINLDGSILFSEIFSDELLSNETVNGILGTINSVDRFPDKESKTIERLKFETHSILFSNFKNFSFSYVFYGQSYLAMKKFQKMLDKLEDSEQFLDEINELSDEPTLEKRMNLVEYINNVFLE
ncbi:MAG: tetratricopeptide repeat protein [Candidatus Heimdallarchaeaceae archaeon]